MMHARNDTGPGNEKGFSLIELLIVVTIISIIAALAQPKLQSVLLKARAADVVANLNVVKVATLSYQGSQSAWPPEAAAGVVPTGLTEFLPDGFSFTEEEYTIDFDYVGGIPYTAGVAIVTTNTDLGLAVMNLLGKGVTNTGTKYSWIID
jgi:prepilin-type N-terminal cleavage/methylation domain-containing protein